MSNTEIENNIVGILHELEAPKMWMTANGIRKRLKNRYGVSKSKQHVFDLLQQLEGNEEQQVRHSKLPSKRTLDYLWGHTSIVKEMDVPSLEKENIFDDFFEHMNNLEHGEGSTCFISHSHKDVDKVIKVCEVLIKNNIYPWLAECEIEQGGLINDNIIEALKESQYFMLFLSKNALKSVWTRKEFELYGAQGNMKTFIVLDNDDELTDLLSCWNENRYDSFLKASITNKSFWNSRCDNFMQSLHEYTSGETPLLTMDNTESLEIGNMNIEHLNSFLKNEL